MRAWLPWLYRAQRARLDWDGMFVCSCNVSSDGDITKVAPADKPADD